MTNTSPEAPPHAARGAVVRIIVIIAIVIAAIFVIGGLVGDIDWSAVGRALGELTWWQIPALVLLLLLRQYLLALPLALFIKGCSAFRAFVNDQAGILMMSLTPPPSEFVMRLAMFSSWGISPSAGMAGISMKLLTFYVVRFAAPLLGIVLMVVTGAWHDVQLSVAIVSVAVSISLIVLTWRGLRQEETAAGIGRTAGRTVHRIRNKVDPEAWAQSLVGFRSYLIDGIGRSAPRAALATVGMLVADAAIILLSVRFVGVPASMLGAIPLLTAYLVAYPLTLFPYQGLGILDAVLIGTLVAEAGEAAEPGLVAGFIIWRVVTLLVPYLLGATSIIGWKIKQPAPLGLMPPEVVPPETE